MEDFKARVNKKKEKTEEGVIVKKIEDKIAVKKIETEIKEKETKKEEYVASEEDKVKQAVHLDTRINDHAKTIPDFMESLSKFGTSNKDRLHKRYLMIKAYRDHVKKAIFMTEDEVPLAKKMKISDCEAEIPKLIAEIVELENQPPPLGTNYLVNAGLSMLSIIAIVIEGAAANTGYPITGYAEDIENSRSSIIPLLEDIITDIGEYAQCLNNPYAMLGLVMCGPIAVRILSTKKRQ